MVSHWKDNYIHGDALLAALFVAYLTIACVPGFERKQALILNAVLAIVINCAFQYEPVEWGRVSAGLAWITMPFAAMALGLFGGSLLLRVGMLRFLIVVDKHGSPMRTDERLLKKVAHRYMAADHI